MNPQERTKVCLSCEADVNAEATYCPFCGTDLSVLSPNDSLPSTDERFQTQTLQESLASLYKPPYSVRNRRGLGVPDERPQPSFMSAEPPKEDPLAYYKQGKGEEKVEKIVEEKEGGVVLPILFLSVGTLFFVLAMALLLFSQGGVLVLEWKSKYWFLYALFSCPFFLFSVRLLRRV